MGSEGSQGRQPEGREGAAPATDKESIWATACKDLLRSFTAFGKKERRPDLERARSRPACRAPNRPLSVQLQ